MLKEEVLHEVAIDCMGKVQLRTS